MNICKHAGESLHVLKIVYGVSAIKKAFDWHRSFKSCRENVYDDAKFRQ